MFYFGSNTKRDLSESAHHEVTQALIDQSNNYKDVQFFLLPSIPFFQSLRVKSKDSRLWLGNQSLSTTSGGDVTGEVSAKTLKALNSDLVMIGHAERRRLFDGPDEIEAQLAAAAKEGLRTLFCIGESARATDLNNLSNFLEKQLKPLTKVSVDLLIAYEPVFSIGESGSPAEPAYVAEVLEIIKDLLSKMGLPNAPLLYGGSVDDQNAPIYASISACQGLFVGRSAWSRNGIEAVFTNAYQVLKAKN